MTRISIITPTFNAAKYIAACVENVTAQNVAGLEHIVVDGGSKDGTAGQLIELAAQYPHLRFVSEKDRGQSDAMNKGIAMATGAAIGFLNVDDYYEPGAVNEALSLLDDNPHVEMVVGNCRAINTDGSTQFWNRPKELRLEAMMLGWSYYQFPCNPSGYFYTRDVHDIAGSFDVDEHYAMDFEFILSCAATIRMKYFDRHWGNYRIIPGTKTYENRANAGVATRAISARFLPRLTARQRLNMRLLKAKCRLKWTYWDVKGRLFG